MHYAKMFDSEYIGAWDLTDDDDKPKDIHVTIDKVEKRVLKSRRGEESKPVLWFRGAKKAMVCNKTNARTIANMHGNDVADWAGKRITLYSTTTQTADGEVPCIRVRPTPPAPPKATKGKKDREIGEEG
jgi:hypothetical protein